MLFEKKKKDTFLVTYHSKYRITIELHVILRSRDQGAMLTNAKTKKKNNDFYKTAYG